MFLLLVDLSACVAVMHFMLLLLSDIHLNVFFLQFLNMLKCRKDNKEDKNVK